MARRIHNDVNPGDLWAKEESDEDFKIMGTGMLRGTKDGKLYIIYKSKSHPLYSIMERNQFLFSFRRVKAVKP